MEIKPGDLVVSKEWWGAEYCPSVVVRVFISSLVTPKVEVDWKLKQDGSIHRTIYDLSSVRKMLYVENMSLDDYL